MSRGTVCSPRARVDDRRRTRWTDGAGIVTAAVGRRRRGRGRWRRSRVPELDCTEEEGEGSEAELLARFDLLRRVPNVGGERRRTAMSRPSSRLGLGFRRRVKRRGGEARGRGRPPYARRGARERGEHGGEATKARGARPWRQGFPCRHSDDTDREGPLPGSSPISFSFYFPVAFRDLIRAFKPF